MSITELMALLEVSIEDELNIKNNSPDKIPLNPTAMGWSGQAVRKALAQALTGADGSLLTELKNKMTLIKEGFRILVEEGAVQLKVVDNVLQYKYMNDSEWLNLIDLKELVGSIVYVGTTEPSNPKENSLWLDIT